MKKNICIIPARKNSKRIKNKNIKSFFGKPIIYYAIKTAIKSKLFQKIVVSTDSLKIKKISEKFGATAPFLRDKRLSNDFTSTKEVLIDAINKLNIKDDFNLFCIYPTAALIDENDLKKAYKKFKNLNADSLLAITTYDHPPQRALKIKGKSLSPENKRLFQKRTQDLKTLHHDSGTFSIFKIKFLKNKNYIFSKKTTYYKLSSLKGIDIDVFENFKLAEYIKKSIN
jgi:pseudaminic acid cytidylyltransferase